MFKKIKDTITTNYFEYAICFLTASFFLGHAILSFSYIIFLLASVKIVLNNFNLNGFLSNKDLVLPCIFFLLNLLIVVVLGDSIKDVLKIEKIHCLIVFPVIFFSSKNYFQQNPLLFFNIKKTLVLTAFFTFLVSLFYGLFRCFYAETVSNSIYITYNHLAELFGVQPLYLAVFYLIAIVFSIDLSRSKTHHRNTYIVISCILFFGIVLLSSRTGLFLSLIILFVNLLKTKLKLKNKNLFLALVLLFFSCVILTLSIPTLKDRVLKLNENISSYSGASFRTKIWKNSYVVFQESPLFGHGIYLSQEKLIHQYRKTNFRRGYISNLNSHNQYLQTLLDTGLIGLLLMILMLVFPVKDIRNIQLSHLLFTVIILVSLIPESFFLRQYGILFYSFFSCIFFISKKELTLNKTNQNNN